MLENCSIDPSHNNLLKGKDMTDAQAHVLEKEYKDIKMSYHMALDMLEKEKLNTKYWRDKCNAIMYQKKADTK
jgi:hypothetical protein